MMGPISNYNFDAKPLLVFWETTKACDLSCKHCRASALTEALPDEMNLSQSIDFIRSLTDFGKPYPILIITGGNMLLKNGLVDILKAASDSEIPISVSPSATPILNKEAFELFRKFNVLSMSLSLDGSNPETHDWLRGFSGTFDNTLSLMREAILSDINLQINTAVIEKNVMQLPEILKILIDNGIRTWEVFFLIKTGRGMDSEDLSPDEYEDVNQWLAYASRYGVRIRTVESPIFRRIVIQNSKGSEYIGGSLYSSLIQRTRELLGEPTKKLNSKVTGTRDGKGIVFVAHNGDVSPSGFLPVVLDNVKDRSIAEIYRENDVFKKLRDTSNFNGKCGICKFNDICGGSRARAYSYSGNLFAEDPSCVYTPI